MLPAEFLNEVANYIPFVAHKWDFIGIKLYQGHLVATLRSSERNAGQKLTEIIQAWLGGTKAPVDELSAWRELVDTLRSPAVNLGAIARKIEDTHVRLLEQTAKQHAGNPSQAMVTGRGVQSEQSGRSGQSGYGGQSAHGGYGGYGGHGGHGGQAGYGGHSGHGGHGGLGGYAMRDSDAPEQSYLDIIRRQQEGKLISFPDSTVEDSVKDQLHAAPSTSHQPAPMQKVNVTSDQGTVVPDSPYYRHGNQQQGNPHVQTSGAVSVPNAVPKETLVVHSPTGERLMGTDNALFLPSPSPVGPLTSILRSISGGDSPASSPSASSTVDMFYAKVPPQEIKELLSKRMSTDNRDDRKCLMRLAKRLPKWRTLGMYLNLPMSTLDELERTGVDADEKATNMLMLWVKESESGTRATLVESLEEADCMDLARELMYTGTIHPRGPVK